VTQMFTEIPCIFWDVTPCSVIDTYQRFRETCYLHFEGNFYPEDVVSMFLRIVGIFLTGYTASHPRRQQPSQPPLGEPQPLIMRQRTGTLQG
jgi:hypothetical protein